VTDAAVAVAGATVEQSQQQIVVQDRTAASAGDAPRKRRAFNSFVVPGGRRANVVSGAR